MSKKALVVAVDAYVAPYTTHSNLNDQADMMATLQAKGFQVSVLTNSGATKANVMASLTGLVQLAQPGDSICFAFFGHGGKSPSSEDDGSSECLCCYDWQSGGLVWDYDIDQIIQQYLASGVNVELVYGCCFAGGLSESPGAQTVVWSACQEPNLAYAVSGSIGARGLHPWLLNYAVRGAPSWSRSAIQAWLATWVQYYAPQVPVLRASTTKLSKLPFS